MPEKNFDLLDDISDVDNEIFKIVRRIKEHAHAQVKAEYALAALQHRQPEVYTKETVKALVRIAALQFTGGVTKGELESSAAES